MENIVTPRFYDAIEQAFPTLPIKYNVGWREVTSLGAGSEIGMLAEPPNDLALAQLLQFCHQNAIPLFTLGAGTDTIGSDAPYNGVVIRLCQNDFIRIRPGRRHITVGAGVRLSDLVTIAARRGFGGIAPLNAIPGTVGGVLRMNAGAHGVSIGQFVEELCGYDSAGNPWSAYGREIEWGYRCSSIPYDVIITGAILSLPEVCKHEEQLRIQEELRDRRQREPRGRSAGCMFKNISSDEPAGRLIDQCGLKKYCCGGASVSERHANYIINDRCASEDDIVRLMSQIRTEVARKTGLYLVPEVCFINYDSVQKIKAACPSPKIAVLKGGADNEREISLQSGAAVAAALRNAGYDVDEIDIEECQLNQRIMDAEVVFPVLHGGFGENGEIQRLLEQSGKKFVGCPANVCAIIIDKIASKELMLKSGVPTPDWAVVTPDNPQFPKKLSLPVMVKVPQEGSTLGIFRVDTLEQWEETLQQAFKYDSRLLVEKCIIGTEITVGIIEDKPLPIIEIVPPNGFYDYDAKYTHTGGETRYLCPPETVSPELQQLATKLAMTFYRAASCRDILRVDFIIDHENNIYVLEGNTMPGFTASSLVPKAAHQAGISMEALCATLVQAAKRR